MSRWILFLFFGACSSGPVRIAPSDDESVAEAIDAWRSAGVDVAFGEDGIPVISDESPGCQRAPLCEPQSWACYHRSRAFRADDRELIVVCEANIPKDHDCRVMSIAHEIGHAMAIDDGYGDGSDVMDQRASCQARP